jgi:hypothetical protein
VVGGWVGVGEDEVQASRHRPPRLPVNSGSAPSRGAARAHLWLASLHLGLQAKLQQQRALDNAALDQRAPTTPQTLQGACTCPSSARRLTWQYSASLSWTNTSYIWLWRNVARNLRAAALRLRGRPAARGKAGFRPGRRQGQCGGRGHDNASARHALPPLPTGDQQQAVAPPPLPRPLRDS